MRNVDFETKSQTFVQERNVILFNRDMDRVYHDDRQVRHAEQCDVHY